MKINIKKYIIGMGSLASVFILPLSLPYNISNSIFKNNKEIKSANNLKYFHNTDGITVNSKIEKIFQDKAGNIWAGTNSNGLWKSTDGNKFVQVKNIISATSKVTDIFQDDNGDMWIGTNSGLYKSDGEMNFTKVDLASYNKNINIIFEDNSKNIWVGTNGGLLKSIDQIEFNKIPLQVQGSEADQYINNIFQDKDGNIWVGDYNISGLWKSTDGIAFTNIIKSSSISSNIIQDKGGNIWVGNGTSGLYKSSDGKTFAQIAGNISKTIITSIKEDKDGNIWVGTNSNGLWKSTNGITFIKINNGIEFSSKISNIFQDKDGNILVGTTSGLYKSTDSLNFTLIGNGIKDQIKITKIFQDSGGNILVGTNGNGLISNINPFNLIYKDTSVNQTHWIGNTKYYLSNEGITLSVDPADNITVDTINKGATINKTNYNFQNGLHSISIKKWNHTYIFNISIKNSLSIDNSYFKTSPGYTLSQYTGYLLGDIKRKVDVKSVVVKSGAENVVKANLNISVFASNLFVDYSKSYYQKLNTDYIPEGSKTNLLDAGETINSDSQTFYLLHIQDILGNIKTFYLQVGGTDNIIPKNSKTGSGITTTGKTKENVNIDGILYDYFTNKAATFYNHDNNVTKIIINSTLYQKNLTHDHILTQNKANNGIFRIQIFLLNQVTPTKIFNVLVKSSFMVDPYIAFSGIQGKFENYEGYVKINGVYNPNKKQNILSNLDDKSKGKKAGGISFNLKYSALDMTGKSYYKKYDPNNYSDNKTTIKSEAFDLKVGGLYKMVLADLMGNISTYYLQIGGSQNIFPHTIQKWSPIVSNIIKINMPSNVESKIYGANGKGTLVVNTPFGTTTSIVFPKGIDNGKLENGQTVKIVYKLMNKPGDLKYVWRNGTSSDITIPYKIAGLGKSPMKTWVLISIFIGIIAFITLALLSVIWYKKFFNKKI